MNTWRIEYACDTFYLGDGDESFWESWDVTNDATSFECRSKEQAEWLLALVSSSTTECPE